MENALAKQFKDCKFVLNPIIKPLIEANPIVFSTNICKNTSTYTIDYIETIWNSIKTDIKLVEVIFQCRDKRVFNFIDKHWTWLVTYYGLQKLTKLNNISVDKYWPTFPEAMPFITKHWDLFMAYDVIPICTLCENTAFIPILTKNWDTLYDKMTDNAWEMLCNNPAAIPLITKKWDDIGNNMCWAALFENPNAIDIIINKWDFIVSQPDIYHFRSNMFANTSPLALQFIEQKWHTDFAQLLDDNHMHIHINTLSQNTSSYIATFIENIWNIICKFIKQHEYSARLFENPLLSNLIVRKWAQIVEIYPNACIDLIVNINPIIIDTPVDIKQYNKHLYDIIDANFEHFLTEQNDPHAIYADYYLTKPYIIPFLLNHWDACIAINLFQNNFYYLFDNPAFYILYAAHKEYFDNLTSNKSLKNFQLCRNRCLSFFKHHPEHLNNSTLKYNTNIEQPDGSTTEYDHCIYTDPDLFIDEYHQIAKNYFREHIAAELMAFVWHPRNISKFPDLGFDPSL